MHRYKVYELLLLLVEKNRVVFAFYLLGVHPGTMYNIMRVYMSCTCDFMYYIPGTTTTCSPYTALLTHTAWHSMNHLSPHLKLKCLRILLCTLTMRCPSQITGIVPPFWFLELLHGFPGCTTNGHTSSVKH